MQAATTASPPPAPLQDQDQDQATSTAVVEVPVRFINAEKGDVEKARARYLLTMQWRKDEGIDHILENPWPHYKLIRQHYPFYYHKRGKHNEPVYYEKPGQINFQAARATGLTLDDLLRNFVMVTEYLWQVIESDDNAKCISVVDVAGCKFSDCWGEPLEYVRKCSSLTGQHFPERCAYIIVINAPGWCSMVWKAVQPLIDEVTRQKITIVKSGSKQKILEALQDKIPVENIPEEYGGQSVGRSPEDLLLDDLMAFVNHDENAPATNPVANKGCLQADK